MAYYGYGSQWPPYVSVAQRRHQAMKKVAQLRKKGVNIRPVEIEGRKIAKTFWGQSWCDHMESLGDYANRLPRGRTYVRNGSVCHLDIQKGRVKAMVSGRSLYHIDIKIDVLPAAKWKRVKKQCAGQIGSLLDLLKGKLSAGVMKVVTDRSSGLFPSAKEIHLDCDCPDWASLCKHLAAVLYGVGARLDRQPELLFLLRGVNHEELIEASADQSIGQVTRGNRRRRTVAAGNLEDVFGIELDEAETPPTRPAKKKKKRTVKRATKKKIAVKISRLSAKKSVKKKSKNQPKETKKQLSKKKAAGKKKVAKKKTVKNKTTATRKSGKVTGKKKLSVAKSGKPKRKSKKK